MHKFDIKIKQLALRENGRVFEEANAGTLAAKLYNPTARTALKTALKLYRVNDDNQPLVNDRARLSDRRLFYSSIEIPTDLEIMITNVIDPSRVDSIFSPLMAAEFKAASGRVSGGISTFMDCAVNSHGESIIDKMFEHKNHVFKIAYLSLPIDPEVLDSGLIEVPLSFGQQITLPVYEMQAVAGSKLMRRHKVRDETYEVGESNGHILLEVTRY